jgi:hypothetical protein
VQGPAGLVKVDKYRPLPDYIETEALEGREHKGILIGGLLSLNPANGRINFLSTLARGAKKNEFCLLPTTELFKAVCALLENQPDYAMKGQIRESRCPPPHFCLFARSVTSRPILGNLRSRIFEAGSAICAALGPCNDKNLCRETHPTICGIFTKRFQRLTLHFSHLIV